MYVRFYCLFVCLMVFHVTFNNFSYIVAVLLVEETEGPGENHHLSKSLTLSYNVVHLALIEIRTHNIQLPYDHGHDGPFYVSKY
jgi:hypothetical protein